MSDFNTSGVRAKPLDVILVDDDPDTQEMTKLLFERESWIVRCCGSMDAAIALATERAPDVLVTDLQLQRKTDGWTLARRLREEHVSTRHVALVLSTGHDPGPDILTAFEAWFRKPVDHHALLERARKLGEESRRRQDETFVEAHETARVAPS